MEINIDEEVFKIRQRSRDRKFSVGYYKKGERSGTLISEISIVKVQKELMKVSSKTKIYANVQYEQPVYSNRIRW